MMKNVLLLTFWSCRKNSLIRKIRLISQFMMSQPGVQTTTLHIFVKPKIGNREKHQGNMRNI